MAKSNKKTRKVVPSREGMESNRTDRPDLSVNRADPSTYITTTQRPLLNNKEEWVRRSFAKGMELRDIVTGCGLRVETVYEICGLDPLIDKVRFDALVEYRNNLILKQR